MPIVCRLCGSEREGHAHPDLPCPLDDKSPHEWVEGFIPKNRTLYQIFEIYVLTGLVDLSYKEYKSAFSREFFDGKSLTETGFAVARMMFQKNDQALYTRLLDNRETILWLLKEEVFLKGKY